MAIPDKFARFLLSAAVVGSMGAGVMGTVAQAGLLEPISVHASPNPQPDLDGPCMSSPNPQPDLDNPGGIVDEVTCATPTPTATPTN